MNLRKIEDALEAASDDFICTYDIAKEDKGFVIYYNYETPTQEYEYNGEMEWLLSTFHFDNKKEFLNWLKRRLELK